MARYADGPAASSWILVNASPARVWELVTDISVPARFSPELRRVRWLDGVTGPEAGARFEGVNHHRALGEWRTVSRVAELFPPSRFGWEVMDADGRFAAAPDPRPMATWRFVLTPEAGQTRLRLGVRIGPARSGLSLAIDRWPDREEELVGHRLAELRAGMSATLHGVATLAQRPGDGG